MKKINFLAMAIAAMMITTSVNAQSYEPSKHEIAVSWGAAPMTDIIDVVGHGFTSGFTGGTISYGKNNHLGAISVEYFNRANKIVGVGGIVSYSHISRDLETNKVKYGESSTNLITVMPALKLNWIDKKHFGLYSKAAIGVTLESTKDDVDNGENRSKSKTRFAFQASLLGADFGSPTIRGFAELGFGQQGIFTVGARYKF